MKWFKDDDWSWNSLRQPYRIIERHPGLVLVEPRLQVLCSKGLCHPTTWNNGSTINHHLNSSSCIVNWRTDVYAFHWISLRPFELKSHVTLMLSKNTIVSQIGKYVLQHAGTLKHFNDLVKQSRASQRLP